MRRYLTLPLPFRIGLLCTIGFVLLLWASPAHADAIARAGSDWVRITARPCSDEKVLQFIQDQKRRLDFRAATAHFGGKDYAVCWTPVPGGVGLIYEDGDQGVVPQGDLKPVPEA